MLSQAPDFSAFIRTTSNTIASKISAQMKVAVFQFLSTSQFSLSLCSSLNFSSLFPGVESFSDQFISAHILSRLLNVDLYKEFEFDEDELKAGKVTYIYEYGKPVDYFVLIVNGKAELETGKEKIVSEVGSFSYFGVSALYVSLVSFSNLAGGEFFLFADSRREGRRSHSSEIEQVSSIHARLQRSHQRRRADLTHPSCALARGSPGDLLREQASGEWRDADARLRWRTDRSVDPGIREGGPRRSGSNAGRDGCRRSGWQCWRRTVA